jgi:type IV pilus assembly protein PilY1
MDLPATGERLTGIPQLINGVIYFSTFIPSDAPCHHGGDGWLMGLDYANGTRLAYPAFDTNSDALLNYNTDIRSGGIKTGAVLGGATFLRAGSQAGQGVALLNRLTGDLVSIASNHGPGGSGRVSWHEVVE